jgi:hypothetical protein
MGYLSYSTLYDRVKIDSSQIIIASDSVRRLGADQFQDKILPDFKRRLDSIDKLLAESRVNLSNATTMLTSLVNEFTSLLYSVGVSHNVWRHWSAVTAFGLLLSGEIARSAQYAALGNEWEFIKTLPDVKINSQQESDLVTWMLLTGKPLSTIPKLEDERRNPWLRLARSIPSQDHETTEESLKIIADFWIEETGGDWNNFYYGRYPVFETPICAVAALARHQGFVPTSLNSEQYRFLEAGLAELEPFPMFPTQIYSPAPLAKYG